jgi:hypothetical protein
LTFNNYVEVEVRPAVDSNEEPRVKICSMEAKVSGKNLPCIECLVANSLKEYSASASNPTDSTVYDKLKWAVYQLPNQFLLSSNPEDDVLRFDY